MTTVVVTGATGTVGSRVLRRLRCRDVSVRAFVRDPDKAAAVLGPDVTLAVGDFAEPDSIRRALEGVDALFLACANDPRQVEYETNAIDAAAFAGVRRIVKLSAIGAQVGSPLAFWDWQGRIEQQLRASSPQAVVLRPSSYMSNLLGSAETIKQTGRLFAPAVDARIALIDPGDVATCAAVVLTEEGHEGRTYTLTGPEALTYAEVAERLSAATGRSVTFVDVPDAAARQGLVQAGLPAWMAEQLVILFGMMRQGFLRTVTDTVHALTGRQPVSFAHYAHAQAAFFAA